MKQDEDYIVKKEYLITYKSGKTKKTPICMYRSHRSCIADSEKHDESIRKDERNKRRQ